MVKCVYCKNSFNSQSFGFLTFGCARNSKMSNDESKAISKLFPVLELGWHGADFDVLARDYNVTPKIEFNSRHDSAAPILVDGQVSFTFCSIQCVKQWLAALGNRLEVLINESIATRSTLYVENPND